MYDPQYLHEPDSEVRRIAAFGFQDAVKIGAASTGAGRAFVDKVGAIIDSQLNRMDERQLAANLRALLRFHGRADATLAQREASALHYMASMVQASTTERVAKMQEEGMAGKDAGLTADDIPNLVAEIVEAREALKKKRSHAT